MRAIFDADIEWFRRHPHRYYRTRRSSREEAEASPPGGPAPAGTYCAVIRRWEDADDQLSHLFPMAIWPRRSNRWRAWA
jgi:hypothetical protein